MALTVILISAVGFPLFIGWLFAPAYLPEYANIP